MFSYHVFHYYIYITLWNIRELDCLLFFFPGFFCCFLVNFWRRWGAIDILCFDIRLRAKIIWVASNILPWNFQSNWKLGIGCWNLVCPGFVQVNKDIALGAAVDPISIYDGNQYDITIMIYKVETKIHMIFFCHPNSQTLGVATIQ